MNEYFEQFNIHSKNSSVRLQDLPWNKHAVCEGVFLKHYVTADMSGGGFSCHLVRVEAGCSISEHVHNDNWELHEVINGSGIGVVAGERIPYEEGTIAIIPQGEKHKVEAGEQDLYLWAKFIPALL